MVSRYREQRSARRQQAAIASCLPDGVATFTADGTVTTWNRAIEEITGYPSGSVVGTRGLEALQPRRADGCAVTIHGAKEIPDVLQILTAFGDRRWISCASGRIPAGRGRAEQRLLTVRDCTEAHLLQQVREDYVTTVAHQLRTPLSPILGWASTLRSRADRLSAHEQQSALESIVRQARRMERLIAHLLEVSRAEEGGPVVTDAPLDLVEVTQAVVDELIEAWPDRVIEVTVPAEPCRALGHALWVEQIIANLVSNALKYAPGPQPVRVCVTRRGSEVEVTVTDEGPGIPPKFQERVFGRFERLPAAGGQAGTGLGLAVARQLAEAVHGRVELQSSPGRGATFVLTLRASGANNQAEVVAAEAPRIGAGHIAPA